MKDNHSDATQLLEQVSLEILKSDPEVAWYPFYREQQIPRIKNDLKVLLNYLDNGSKVVDLGATPPILLSTLSKMGFDAVGVDLNPDLFANTRDKFGLKIFKVDIEVERLPFTTDSFDCIIFTEVFEHLRINPVFTVSEIYRVLKPDGLLLLETPNLYSLKGITNFLLKGKTYACCVNNIYQEFKSVEETGFFGHIREYTFQEVFLFLKEIGFRNIKIAYRSAAKRIWIKPIYQLAPFLQPSMMFIAVK